MGDSPQEEVLNLALKYCKDLNKWGEGCFPFPSHTIQSKSHKVGINEVGNCVGGRTGSQRKKLKGEGGSVHTASGQSGTICQNPN